MAGGGGQRQLFSITKEPIKPPPGLALANMFGGFEREEEEEQEFELLEAVYEEGYQPKFEPGPKPTKGKPMKKVPRKSWKPMKQVMSLTAEPMEEPVHALSGASWLYVDPETKWRRVRSVMDSGASDNCSPPELAPEVEIVESAGSKRGQKYSAAGGKSIENLGEKTVDLVTEAWEEVAGTYQIAEVVRPLNSVRKVCEKGNRVIFEYDGGMIQNLTTGHVTPFGVEGDIYTLDLWMPPIEEVKAKGGQQCDMHNCMPCGNNLGFPRQGYGA